MESSEMSTFLWFYYSFSSRQFCIVLRLHSDSIGLDILMIFENDDISCVSIPIYNSNIDGFFLKLSFRKKKWLLCCSYNRSRKDQSYSTLHVEILKSKRVMVHSYEIRHFDGCICLRVSHYMLCVTIHAV